MATLEDTRKTSPLTSLGRYMETKRVEEVRFRGEQAWHVNCGARLEIRGLRQPQTRREVGHVMLACGKCEVNIALSVANYEARRGKIP